MKKQIAFTAIISSVVVGISVFVIFALLLRPTTLDVGSVDMNMVQDGEYIGVCQNKLLVAVVRVEIQDHQIIGIRILEHKESYMDYAEEIGDIIIAEQSVEVDAISGATLTSDTVKKAIEAALLQGIK